MKRFEVRIGSKISKNSVKKREKPNYVVQRDGDVKRCFKYGEKGYLTNQYQSKESFDCKMTGDENKKLLKKENSFCYCIYG